MPSPQSFVFKRRTLFSWLGWAAFAPFNLFAQPAIQKVKPKSPPVWTGFGLNGGSGQARFNLTRDYVKKIANVELKDPLAFRTINESLKKQLSSRNAGQVQFKDSIEFGEDLLLGFAHDYDTVVGARLEKDGQNANTLVIFMSGVGMILTFSKSTGWRILSSFPFILRVERPGGDLKDLRGKALNVMGEAYSTYAQSFSTLLSRFNKWDQGFSSNFFARVTKSSIHPDAEAKLKEFKIDQVLNAEFLGFSTSSSLCDNLDIPLLPFQENDALANRYAVKFSDDLSAQQSIDIPDSDLRFEIILRFIGKKKVNSSQLGVTIVSRRVVVRLQVFDMFSSLPENRLMNILADSTSEDKIPLDSVEDDTPERDLVFIDREITKILANLTKGLKNKDESALASVGVKLSSVAPVLPRFTELCAKTKG